LFLDDLDARLQRTFERDGVVKTPLVDQQHRVIREKTALFREGGEDRHARRIDFRLADAARLAARVAQKQPDFESNPPRDVGIAAIGIRSKIISSPADLMVSSPPRKNDKVSSLISPLIEIFG
jgi:hypothetical protein